jgi:hypothetical protein
LRVAAVADHQRAAQVVLELKEVVRDAVEGKRQVGAHRVGRERRRQRKKDAVGGGPAVTDLAQELPIFGRQENAEPLFGGTQRSGGDRFLQLLFGGQIGLFQPLLQLA